MDFAVKAGFMTPEEAAQTKQMGQMGTQMGVTTGPGGCKGKEECDAYCLESSHMEECIEFGKKMGLMPAEEAEQAQKGMEMMQRGGPGGCKSEAECKTYCEQPSHLEECTNFAVQQGFMSAEEAQKMKERMPMPSEGMPPEGGIVPSDKDIEKMKEMAPPPEGMMPTEGIPSFPPPEGKMPSAPPPEMPQ